MKKKGTAGRKATGAAPLERALRKCERQVMKLPGVTSVWIGEDAHIVVGVVRSDKALQAKIPQVCDDVPVRIEVTGEFNAQSS